MKCLPLLAALCLLAAAASARPSQGRDPLRGVHRIVMLGDSITQMGGRPGGYVSQVAYYLKKLYPEHPIEIVNAGVSGNRSSEMRDRFQRDVLDRKPDLVTISVGINDVWHGFDAEHPQGDGPRGIPLEAFRENVTAMLEAARTAGARVILFTTTIFEDEPDSPRNKKALAYNRVLRELARRPSVDLADQYVACRDAWKSARASGGPRLTIDQVHMAPAGDRLMAKVALLALGVRERDLDEVLPDPTAVRPQQVFCTHDYSDGAVVDWDGNVFISHGKEITRVTPGGNPTEWVTTREPNGHKILPTGHHLVCDAGRHAVLELDADGNEVRLAAFEVDGEPLKAPNDLALDPEGGFYFTDPGGSAPQNPVGAIDYVTPGGHVSRFAAGFAFPNGIALSADRRRLFVSESLRNRILVWDLAGPGKPAGPARPFAELPPPDPAGSSAVPDGIALDARGDLWVAHFGQGKIRVLDPEGKLIGSYDAGNRAASNLCFGGPEFDQLYVTGGDPGCLFRLDLGIPGQRLLPNRRPKPPRLEKKEPLGTE